MRWRARARCSAVASAGSATPLPIVTTGVPAGTQPRSSVRTSLAQATSARLRRAARPAARRLRPEGGESWWNVARTRTRGATLRAATALSQGPRSWACATEAPESVLPRRRIASADSPRTSPRVCTGTPAASAQARTGPSFPKATRLGSTPQARDRAARSTTSRSSPPTSRPWMTCATFTGSACRKVGPAERSAKPSTPRRAFLEQPESPGFLGPGCHCVRCSSGYLWCRLLSGAPNVGL